MTNQASEDELREKINSALFADDFPILNDIEKDAVDRILAIIRTEKLKLLAEVRERVVGENEPEFNTPKPEIGNMARNRLREAQIESLTKLEAEL